MRAAQTMSREVVEIREIPEPAPGPGEVLLEVATVTLCGTDAHIWQDDYATDLPIIQGHEFSAVVRRIGGDAGTMSDATGTPVRVGDLVVVAPAKPCGRCWACEQGRANACAHLSVLGCYEDGALAERLVVGAEQLIAVPEGVEPSTAALAEPVSIATHAVSRGEPRPGERCVVIGCGPIGVLAIRHLVDEGVDVLAVDTREARLGLAERFGASRTLLVDPHEGLSARLRRERMLPWSGEDGPSLVVEASGVPASLQAAVELVCSGGRIVQVGISEKTVELPMRLLPTKELDIRGSRNSRRDLSHSLRFIARHRELIGSLITHRVDFEDVARGFEILADPAQDAGKVAVVVREPRGVSRAVKNVVA